MANELMKDPKAMKKAKDDFALHCLLVQRQDAVTPTQSRFIAWSEGEAGLTKRLAPKG